MSASSPLVVAAAIVPVSADAYLPTPKAAKVIGMSPSWLEHDRQKPKPDIPYSKFGRAVRYLGADLIAYGRSRSTASTAA